VAGQSWRRHFRRLDRWIHGVLAKLVADAQSIEQSDGIGLCAMVRFIVERIGSCRKRAADARG